MNDYKILWKQLKIKAEISNLMIKDSLEDYNLLYLMEHVEEEHKKIKEKIKIINTF